MRTRRPARRPHREQRRTTTLEKVPRLMKQWNTLMTRLSLALPPLVVVPSPTTIFSQRKKVLSDAHRKLIVRLQIRRTTRLSFGPSTIAFSRKRAALEFARHTSFFVQEYLRCLKELITFIITHEFANRKLQVR